MIVLDINTVRTVKGTNAYHKGDISGNEIWNASVIHYIDDEFNVTRDTTLVIEEGTTVLMDSSHGAGKLVVKGGGKLVINGTSEAAVKIDSNNTNPRPGDYLGIVLEYGSTAFINHTIIENATVALDIGSDEVRVNHCIINNSLDWGMKISGEGVLVNSSRINNTGDGGAHSGGILVSRNAVISGSEISHSNSTGIYVERASPTILDTHIHNTTGPGIKIMGSSTPDVRNCNISDTWAENLHVAGDKRTVTLVNCTIGNWTDPGPGDTVVVTPVGNANVNLTLLNTSFKNDTFDIRGYANLTVKWHLDVGVRDENGAPVRGANLTLIDDRGNVDDRGRTDANGSALFLEGVEFVNNGSGFTYEKYYSVNVSIPGFENASQDLWLDAYNRTYFVLNDTGAPVADAGLDRHVDQHTLVTFDGGRSHDNVGIVNYTWSLVHNSTAVELYGAHANFTFHSAGEYPVRLNVSDNASNTAEDVVNVVVRDITSPVADAGEDIIVDQNTSVLLNASGSKDNVGIVSYMWQFEYDDTMNELSGKEKRFRFDIPGVYNISLMVSDGEENWDTDDLKVTVNDTSPPEIDAGAPINIDQGGEAVFNASAADNVGIDNYTWSFEYNGTVRTLYESRATFVFDLAGLYNITLNVTDLRGNWAADTLTVTVRDVSPPEVDAGASVAADQHTSVKFNATAADNVGVVNYTWSFEYNGSPRELPGKSPEFLFDLVGTYNITLKVKDARGNWATDHLEVVIRDTTPPEVDAGADAEVDQNATVIFNGTATDNVGVTSYVWSFDHNGTQQLLYGRRVSFNFAIPGSYNVTFNCSDDAGNWATDHVTVTVEKTGPENATDNETGGPRKEEETSYIWLWTLIVAGLALSFIAVFFWIERGRKLRAGREMDEAELNRITSGRMDFIILRRSDTNRFKKYELRRIQGSSKDIAGIFWDTARDSTYVLDRVATGSPENVAKKIEYDIKKNLKKGYSLDYFGTGYIMRLLGKRFV